MLKSIGVQSYSSVPTEVTGETVSLQKILLVVESLIWPKHSPESHFPIVASRRQDLTWGVPVHSPDHLLVCVVNLMKHALLSIALCSPEDYLAIVRWTRKHLFLVRVPADNWDLCILAFEAVDLIIGLSNVKDFDSLILTASDEPVAIDWVPSDLVNCIVMSRNVLKDFTCAWVP